MIDTYLLQQIIKSLPYVPTEEQYGALQAITGFLLSRENDSLLLLKGYAGTGKTSLLGAVVKTLTGLKQKTLLLAPTGRAAKVFSEYSGEKAYTIHRKIYRQKSFGMDSGFSLTDNLHKDTLFLVDEASMIANQSQGNHFFGTGCLLDDLIHFVYSGENCRLLLLGDDAQLPPVQQIESPALNRDLLQGYGLHVIQVSLTQVVRQTEGSGILFNATRIREALRRNQIHLFPKLHLAGFPDLKPIPGGELIEEISSAYSRDGIDETMVICRSNKRANSYNQGIRNRILYREEELSSGDLLMVAKNNYFWTADCKEMDFIANGEIVRVQRVRRQTEFYGFRFCEALVYFPDHEVELEVKVILDTLQSDSPALSGEQADTLFHSILEDYAYETTKAGKMKKLKADPYYNAVQVKYAYAVTCHKAQGGQWKNVFLDIGYVTEEMLGEDFYRWLYTAFTRATRRLYLVNLPDEFLDT
ncbi:ATP-dependent RecD-like DNA helicase [Parabacteroides sp. Marseille-P3160]|uniref:ATP-dependent DNA helicase n=1 Tax=Parabacteroides sp. Marseille-P3160 TaxID=1917887 RepID=UPI0009BB77A3|nr:AAA family ATPase [Parabacteroides sp. Marseille-P3160]